MKVKKEFIQDVISIYLPQYRCLISASYEYPKIEGLFKIQRPSYTEVNLDYLTIFDTQLATIQMGLVLFAQAIQQGNLPIPLAQSVSEFKEMTSDLQLDIHNFQVKFRKKLDTAKKFTGKMNVEKLRKFGEFYIAHLPFDIENSSALGTLEAVVRLNS